MASDNLAKAYTLKLCVCSGCMTCIIFRLIIFSRHLRFAHVRIFLTNSAINTDTISDITVGQCQSIARQTPLQFFYSDFDQWFYANRKSWSPKGRPCMGESEDALQLGRRCPFYFTTRSGCGQCHYCSFHLLCTSCITSKLGVHKNNAGNKIFPQVAACRGKSFTIY